MEGVHALPLEDIGLSFRLTIALFARPGWSGL